MTETEKSETRSRLEGELYLVAKTRKFVLLRVDELLSEAHGVKYDLPLITVEHVLPQNPSADSRWVELFDSAQREHWTHRLGNLVLLNRAKNSAAQNHDFAAKKARYFTGRGGSVPFALTSQVLQHDDWTPEALAARQRRLVDLLATEWAL
ncbi:HNH endonuclease family protein [Streptomyces sp. NPDC004237]|uniref:HNH endonuclease family protein n=1 Tax=Streptomyces sp. NPDC004237 TaxID=3154455 RepID=UPI0033A30263